MPVSIGDLLGFVTGLACVWLAARGNIWNFPVGILNGAVLGVVFLNQRLFADAALQVVFIVLGVRGLQQWLAGNNARETSPVFRVRVGELGGLALAGLILTVLLWVVLGWLKGSAPIADALITSLSVCAQWLLNRRVLENWVLWVVVDVISIPLYLSRQLPLIAALYVVFLALCVQGYRRWQRQVVAPREGHPA
jgi:nicotinamide mononucleotide transporter